MSARRVHLPGSSLEKNLLTDSSVWFCTKPRVAGQSFSIMPPAGFPQNDTIYWGTMQRKRLKATSHILESLESQPVTWPLTVGSVSHSADSKQLQQGEPALKSYREYFKSKGKAGNVDDRLPGYHGKASLTRGGTVESWELAVILAWMDSVCSRLQ